MIMTQDVSGFGIQSSAKVKEDKAKKQRSVSVGGRSESSAESGLASGTLRSDSQGRKGKLRMKSVAEESESGDGQSRLQGNSTGQPILPSLGSLLDEGGSRVMEGGGGGMDEEFKLLDVLSAPSISLNRRPEQTMGSRTQPNPSPPVEAPSRRSATSRPLRSRLPGPDATSTPNPNQPLQPDREPLFYPNSQEIPFPSTIPLPAASQLTQAQLEDIGLGDLNEMDLGLEDDWELEDLGQAAVNEPESGVVNYEQSEGEIRILPTQRHATNPDRALVRLSHALFDRF